MLEKVAGADSYFPTEKILYKNKVGETERVDEFEYIIPDGSIDRETAEYFVKLHQARLNNIYEMNKELRCKYCYRTVDSYFYNYSCKFCYDKGLI